MGKVGGGKVGGAGRAGWASKVLNLKPLPSSLHHEESRFDAARACSGAIQSGLVKTRSPSWSLWLSRAKPPQVDQPPRNDDVGTLEASFGLTTCHSCARCSGERVCSRHSFSWKGCCVGPAVAAPGRLWTDGRGSDFPASASPTAKAPPPPPPGPHRPGVMPKTKPPTSKILCFPSQPPTVATLENWTRKHAWPWPWHVRPFCHLFSLRLFSSLSRSAILCPSLHPSR